LLKKIPKTSSLNKISSTFEFCQFFQTCMGQKVPNFNKKSKTSQNLPVQNPKIGDLMTKDSVKITQPY